MTPNRNTGLRSRLWAAVPPICDIKLGTLFWAVAMLVASLGGQWYYFREATSNGAAIAAVYFAGGLFAWPFALFFARLVALHSGTVPRHLAAFASLLGCTLAMTAFIFSQQFRSVFAHTHQPITTITGIFQFTETSASGVYQFLVVGIRLYFPLGILALILASLWLARRMR